MTAASKAIDSLWNPSWETLYEAYFHELAAQSVVTRWQKIDIAVAILVAATASGSVIAGWSLWSAPSWKTLWLAIAGIAAVVSTAHGAMAVPRRIKDQEEIRRNFSGLRVSLQTFRQDLRISLDGDEAFKRYHEQIGRAHV